MYLRLQLLGNGDENDQFRVDLPAATLSYVDYDNGYAVAVPNFRINPPQVPPANSPLWQPFGPYQMLVGLEPAQLAAWHALIRQRYPDPYPVYTPQFV